jgi:ankyrin repeat protein
MPVQRSSWYRGWAVVVTAGLAACTSEPAPLLTERGGDYQPASLAEAVLVQNRTAVENFLALGVDPNDSEGDGTTPLMRAVQLQRPDLVMLLIDAGADVRKANYYGVTALYIAAREGDLAAVRTLLAAGADANATLPAGETVLMTAAKTGDAAIVRALLTGGAESVSLSQLGDVRAAARAAEMAGYSSIGNPAVATNYADVNARERWYGRTALMLAAAEGHGDVVDLLIEAGSDVNLLDEQGASALSLARDFGNLDVAAKLEEAGAR